MVTIRAIIPNAKTKQPSTASTVPMWCPPNVSTPESPYPPTMNTAPIMIMILLTPRIIALPVDNVGLRRSNVASNWLSAGGAILSEPRDNCSRGPPFFVFWRKEGKLLLVGTGRNRQGAAILSGG